MTATLPAVAALATRLQVDHEVGVVLLWGQHGYTFAVVEAATGHVVAWDGWHVDDEVPAQAGEDLCALPWEDGQDTAEALLHQANGP